MTELVPGEPARSATRSKVGGLFSLLAGVTALGALGYVFHSHRVELAHALKFDARVLLPMLLVAFVTHLLRAVEYDVLLVRLGVKEPFRDGFLLTAAVLLLNYLPFNAGEVVRAVSLRRTRELAYTAYVAALGVGALMNALVAGVLGLVASLLVTGTFVPALGGVFLALALLSALGLVVPSRLTPRGTSRWSVMRGQMHAGMALVGTRHGLWALAGLSVVKFGLNAVRIVLGFGALGQAISWPNAALLGAASVVASVINLAPGNLGVREFVLGAAAGVAGGSPVLAMAAASFDRAVMLAYTMVAGVPGLIHWRRKLGQA
jgi:uncharacterized membrane protein YbhN (UPF0104 family)